MNPDLKALERRFYSDGYRLAIHAVDEGFSEQKVLTAVRQMHRMVDEVIESFTEYAATENQSPDCKKGCSWCCWQPVFALSYELDSLKDYLKAHFTDEELRLMVQRAKLKNEKLKVLKGEALLNTKSPCPLLSRGVCVAYSARPVACRIYLSQRVNSCINFYNEPESPDAVPALLEFPMRIGRIINEGFRAGLKAAGITTEEMRIEEGIENIFN